MGRLKSVSVEVIGPEPIVLELTDDARKLLVVVDKDNLRKIKLSVTPAGAWAWSKSNGYKDRKTKYYDSKDKLSVKGDVFSLLEGKDSFEIEVTADRAWITMDAEICKSDKTYYFGVSRVDGGREEPVLRTATLDTYLKKASYDYSWKSASGNWRYADGNPPKEKEAVIETIVDKKTTDAAKNDACPKYSRRWMEEIISGSVSMFAAKTNFTIVAVNVSLGGMDEATEESEGYCIPTNTPVKVNFEVLTKDLPEDVDKFELTCDNLYQKAKGGRDTICITGANGKLIYYKKFDTKRELTTKDINNKGFYLICTQPSASWNGGYVTLRHTLSGAVDRAKYVAYAIDFITPKGSPEKYQRDKNGNYVKTNAKSKEPADRYVPVTKNEEKDSGRGQNEFCFDDESKKLEIRLEVGIRPQPDDSKVAANLLNGKTGTFTLEKLRRPCGSGVPTWSSGNAALSKKVKAKNGVFSATATYSGYPVDNDGFGKYQAKFSGCGVELTAEYEVFFPMKGTNHPFCTKCPGCPNWFFYWKDGAVPALNEGDILYSNEPIMAGYAGKHFGNLKNNQISSIIKLSDLAAEKSTKEYDLGNGIVVGKSDLYCGVVCTAAICAHEKMHQRIFLDLSEVVKSRNCDQVEVDADTDGVLDANESPKKVYYFITNVGLTDTFRFSAQTGIYEYQGMGDNEVNARRAERLSYDYDIFKDWAKPGCQSAKPYGPNAD